MRKNSLLRLAVISMLLLSMLMGSMISASAEATPFTPAASDGMVFTPKNYVQKGITCRYVMGAPMPAGGGYNYSPLFGYLLNNEVNSQNTLLYIDDFTGWVTYDSNRPVPSTEYNEETPGSNVGGGNMELRLKQETQNRSFEGTIYMAAYEVDLAEVNKITGYVMHYSWANENDDFKDNYDFDFYVSNDGVTWSKITTVKGAKAKTASASVTSLDEAGVSEFLSTACENVDVAGTYRVFASDEKDERGNAAGRKHPVLDVKFDKAIEARYIRVAFKTGRRTSAGENCVFCYGLEVYNAATDAPFESDLSPKVEKVTTEDTVTTETPIVTTEPTTQSAPKQEEKGCSGTVGMVSVAMIAVCATCMMGKRKKED